MGIFYKAIKSFMGMKVFEAQFVMSGFRCRGRGGFILVAVLWLAVLLTLIVAVAARSSRLETRLAMSFAQKQNLYWASRGGIESAISVLGEDDEYNDSFDDLWYGNAGLEDIEFTGCSCTVSVVDEAGRLSVNNISKKQLMCLPGMTEEIADSILDWRDKNNEALAEGAEEEYYQSLVYPYKPRNEDFQMISELLLVKGVDREYVYGADGIGSMLTCFSYSLNEDADGDERVNINKADENEIARSIGIDANAAKEFVESRPKGGYKSIGDLLSKSGGKGKLNLEAFSKIADKITVSDEKILPGRVNVNTASYSVLYALFEEDQELVDEVYSTRQGLIGGFSDRGALGSLKAMNAEKMKKYIDQVTTKSSVFEVSATAVSNVNNAKFNAVAVVDRHREPAEIVYFYCGAGN